jgi:hypothetical protein
VTALFCEEVLLRFSENENEKSEGSDCRDVVLGALPEAISEWQKRETTRLFIILGKPEAAVRILCPAKVTKDAFKDNVDACQESN